MKEEKRRDEQHKEACEYKQILRVALPSENQPEKGDRPHDSGAYGRRNESGENHINDNCKDDGRRRKPARQPKK